MFAIICSLFTVGFQNHYSFSIECWEIAFLYWGAISLSKQFLKAVEINQLGLSLTSTMTLCCTLRRDLPSEWTKVSSNLRYCTYLPCDSMQCTKCCMILSSTFSHSCLFSKKMWRTVSASRSWNEKLLKTFFKKEKEASKDTMRRHATCRRNTKLETADNNSTNCVPVSLPSVIFRNMYTTYSN